MTVLALDLGGTKLAVAVLSMSGEILFSETIPLEGRVGGDVGGLIQNQVRQHMHKDVTAVGISVPGISRHRTGTVWAPNIPGWEDYPLVSEIRSVAGRVPVSMDSDRACSILGELWLGAAKGCRDAIYMAVGTGIGAGILVDGNIVRGADDIAGAVGWLALKKPFEEKFVSCGCYEYYASGDGIARYANELISKDRAYTGELLNHGDKLTAQHVFEAFDRNDSIARSVIQECIELWGMAVANFISIFNPSKIIFGGGVFGPAVRFIPDIRQEARKWAQPISFTKVSFEHSALGGNAAIFGAGFLALGNNNQPAA